MKPIFLIMNLYKKFGQCCYSNWFLFFNKYAARNSIALGGLQKKRIIHVKYHNINGIFWYKIYISLIVPFYLFILFVNTLGLS